MMPGEPGVRLALGSEVQSPFGRGVVRDLRNNGRVLVEVQGRTIVMDVRSLTPLAAPPPSRGRARVHDGRDASDGAVTSVDGAAEGQRVEQSHGVRELDLHGLTVEEALVRIGHVLDGAMRDDLAELRVIHGRSGGRLRAALHRHLAAIPSVRAFGLDPRNEGVTVVLL